MPLQVFTPQDIHQQLAALTDLLCEVVNGGASVSFMAPLSEADAHAYWQKVADAVQQNTLILIVAQEGDTLAGQIQLGLAWQPNSPHRAEVQKLMVRDAFRRQGIASQLLTKAEQVALAAASGYRARQRRGTALRKARLYPLWHHRAVRAQHPSRV